MENKLDVWMISRISAFTGWSISTTQGNAVTWDSLEKNNLCEVILDFEKKELGFVDWVGDDKTYYSLVGVALMAGFTTEDYFTEKN
jgi:hypothetical protein